MFTVVSAISLVLCAGTGWLWVRSYSRVDYFQPRDEHLLISSDRGCVFCSVNNHGPDWAYDPDHVVFTSYPRGLIGSYEPAPGPILGFGLQRYQFFRGSMTEAVLVVTPDWFLLMATAAMPAMWYVKRRRSRVGNRAGLCSSCRYDLRATPGRCPECGKISS
jgi:hypothetical protein